MTRIPSSKTATSIRGLLLSALVISFLQVAALARADEPSKESKENFLKSNAKFLEAFKKPVAKPAQATVLVFTNGSEAALGTIVGPDGWILTKASEITMHPLCKFKDGRELVATVVGVQKQYDLAMLKVDAKGLPAVEFQESKVAPVGNWVASVGLGETPVAVGVVSVAARSLSPAELKFPNINAKSGFLGVGLETTKEGPKVTSITDASAAAKAGIKKDDIVMSIAGKRMEDRESVMEFLSHTKPGDVLVVKVKRGSEELELKPELGKRPTDRGDLQNNMGSELSGRRTGFPTFVQHDTVLKPKECGGPLVDLDGKVIGINIARAGRVESYAIPSEVVLALLPDLMSGKLPPKEEALKQMTAEDRLLAAKAELKKAEEDKAALEKREKELRETVEKATSAAKGEALTAARKAVKEAEEEKALADERVDILRREVTSAITDGKAPPSKAIREKAEEEQKAAAKHLKEARAALEKLEAESK